MHSSIIPIYESRISDFSRKYNSLKKRLSILSISRLLVFIAGVFTVYFLFKINVAIAIVTSIFFISAFLLLIKRYDKLNKETRLLEELIKVNQDEIEALKMNFTHFATGDEFTNEDHDYTYDLDIFGKGSIFQFINRTCTLRGKKLLAKWFSNPVINQDEIARRQEAVEELNEKLDFRQQFRTVGNLFSESPNNQKITVQWLTAPNAFAQKSLKVIAVLLPMTSIILIVLAAFSVIHYKYLILYFLIAATTAWRIEKSIGKHHVNLTAKQKLLDKYVDLLKLIEQENLTSEKLKTLKVILEGEAKASLLIKKLSILANALDTRRSLVPVLINIVSLRDLNNVLQLEKWKQKFGERVDKWLQTVAEIDAFISLGGFSFNYPDYEFPICVDDKIIKAKELGHPLIHNKKRVNNDFEIDRLGTLVIITGANMAGKSTFLRTLGVNLILAMMGSVVCARNFEFSPIHLFTNMRTKDSLLKDESYFRAELNRLKLMIDKLQAGERLFVLLDELLKGTNSQDQHLGSVALIEKLILKNACGCLATHDLELSKLEEKYPAEISNNCFEVELNQEELKFDYKLKEGVSQNMNAFFLLKKMGIT